MKYSAKFLVVLGLLLPALLALRPQQGLEYTLLLNAYSGVSGSDYRIGLTRRPGYVLARYERLDSIQRARFAQDQGMQALRQAFVAAMNDRTVARAARERAAEQFAARVEAFKVYQLDSLRLDTEANPGFAQLLDSVYIASNAKLEQPAASQHRLARDGTSLRVVISSPASEPRVVYAHAPQPASHPLLYRVLHQSLQVYRSRRPQGLLPLSYTGGY